MKGIVIIPAYNEELAILPVLLRMPRAIDEHKLDLIVINDGSRDQTSKVVRKAKTKLITHAINRGLGAALGTGFEYARRKNYDFLITLDGDGQHDPKEIKKLIKPIIFKQADFVIGSRIFKKGMPTSRLLITFLASLATYFFTGVWTTDSQSGFRAFSKQAIDKIKIEVDRMEVSSDFFRQSRIHHLKYKEIHIKPIYTEYSIKKGQNYFNSANILAKLALKRIVD